MRHSKHVVRWEGLRAPVAALMVVFAGVVITGDGIDHPFGQALGTTASPVRFASASISPNASGDTRGGCCRLEAGGRLSATNATLRQLILAAHQRHACDRRELRGGPAWIDSARFDLAAQATDEHVIDADGVPRTTWTMLQVLLTERFKLRLRVDGEPRPVYRLVQAGNGRQPVSRQTASTANCVAVMILEIRGQRPDKPSCGAAWYPGRFVASGLTMASVASLLTTVVDRPVIDRTNLRGGFDLDLEAVEIRPTGPFGPSLRPSDTTESIFQTLVSQLGLRLEPAEESIHVLVVEHVERPGPE